MPTRRSTLRSVFEQRCPRCRTGRIYRDSIFRIYLLRLPQIYDRCPVCRLKFEREPGYFLGAMYISYALGVLAIVAIALLVWAVTGWGIMRDVFGAMILFMPIVPAITLGSRVLWIWLDQGVDPEP